MPLNIVIGAQWGDEGKGRITDLLAAQADMVVRYSGGDNAGHTVTIGDEVFKLHLIPSGIIHDTANCLIGNGVVVNPKVMLHEMDALAKRGIDVSPACLKLSENAHLITPAHIALDKAREMQRGEGAIGTTLRGIGPAYTDKASRQGIRAGLMANPEELADAIHTHVATHNEVLTKIYGADALDTDAVAAEYAAYAQRLAPYLVDGSILLDEALRDGRSILAEGAQGTLLDIDHGTYPFVTSSSPTAGGALTGLGVGPKQVGQIIGVAKAFTTRVGSGPFPTELSGSIAARLRGTGENPWDEYGTTTGRPRRVGWLDLVILRHAQRINSLTDLALTKLDILSGIPELQVCVAYELDGRRLTHFPTDLNTLARCRPIYQTLPGWHEDIMPIRTFSGLPANAQNYVNFITDQLGIPASIISVGPAREQTISF
ncbi:MAG: adenylosuccinate synthase [Ardenticatenaceae bacterium]|nr:adenylosuccinate synthase [Anaerolineales bacterium]MCB8921996.1 adenylosuccinate synthase [Ardenticatenaceae bacterium]MCB8989572.1 adenylosuccinate synthase [Ardenticatenaceae bacterium]MCB9003115.1 adenylosuccinate synthase [Ardenticatenaceae bacterium]